MKISKGLATWAGVVAAAGQYLGAVAVFLVAPDPALALGPLGTATVTLFGVIKGRMDQATAAIQSEAKQPTRVPYSNGLAPIVVSTELHSTEFEREPVNLLHEQRELDCA